MDRVKAMLKHESEDGEVASECTALRQKISDLRAKISKTRQELYDHRRFDTKLTENGTTID